MVGDIKLWAANSISEYYSSAWEFVSGHPKTVIGISTLGVGIILFRRWTSGGKVRSKARLDGKIAIVTGSNCGIGLETAKFLAARGAFVVLACRDPTRAADAVTCVKEYSGSSLVKAESLDLASLESVREFVRRFKESHDRLDVLINNAAVMGCPESRTVDGFEMNFGVNYLGHFLLTCLLLDVMKRTPQSRIINVSSEGHRMGGRIRWDNLNMEGEYNAYLAYNQSKLANVLFTKALAERLQNDDVTTYCVHPGGARTQLLRDHSPIFRCIIYAFGWIVFKSPMEGAQTSLHCALAPLSELKSGEYYGHCQVVAPSKAAQSMEDARRLWDVSERLVGLKSGEGDK